MVFLPYIALLLCFCYFGRQSGLREAILRGSVAWAVFLYISTEILSSFYKLNCMNIAILWTVFIILLLLASRNELLSIVSIAKSIRVSRNDLWYAVPISAIILIQLHIAYLSAPNNYDSMTYHLPRIYYWLQNESVAHYKTSNIRQLCLAPWAEFAMLHLQALSGSDLFAATVQWLAFVGSAIAASYIVALLGYAKPRQWMSVVLVATAPMLILQSCSTQNDLVCAFWVASTVAFILADLEDYKGRTLFIGLSVGLAALTKSTAFLFLAPFLVWWFLKSMRALGLRKTVSGTVIISILALSLNACHFIRNYKVFRNPISHPAIVDIVSNQQHGLAQLTSNLMREASLHLYLPATFHEYNTYVYRSVVALHKALGINPNNELTTINGKKYGPISVRFWDEEITGNFFLFLLLLLSLPIAFIRRSPNNVRLYGLCCCVGIIFFCWLFKWQPYNSRLHTPLFLIVAPFVASVLPVKFRGWNLGRILVIVLFLSSIPCLVFNTGHPFFSMSGSKSIFQTSRIEQYFIRRPQKYAPFKKVIDLVGLSACRDIGLKTGGDSVEYPLFQLAKEKGLNLRFRHVYVRDIPADRNATQACAIIAIDQSKNWHPADQAEFQKVWADDDSSVALFLRIDR